MPLTKVNSGDLITSQGWNDMIDEIDSKVAKAGDSMTGPLLLAGGQSNLNATNGDLRIGNDANNLKIGVTTSGIAAGMVRLSSSGSPNRILALAFGAENKLTIRNNSVDIGTDSDSTNLVVNGTSSSRSLSLTTVDTEREAMTISRGGTGGFVIGQPELDNMLVTLGFRGLLIPGDPPPPLTYSFRVGHRNLLTGFFSQFSVTHEGNVFIRGNLTVSGSKGGYVADFFINAVGDRLEKGDVVVLGTKSTKLFYGAHNNIPVPEVDLTDKAYDTRVCGIVSEIVSEDELPPIDWEGQGEAVMKKVKANKIKRADILKISPIRKFVKAGTVENRSAVPDKQMGKMVTLGCFAHCKVDADIASIQAGDLLTTSPTKGHAQKVTDRAKASGAIIGKALATKRSGKGVIPIMVLMQ